MSFNNKLEKNLKPANKKCFCNMLSGMRMAPVFQNLAEEIQQQFRNNLASDQIHRFLQIEKCVESQVHDTKENC